MGRVQASGLVLVSATAAAVGTAFPSTLLRLFSGKPGLKLGHTCSTRRQEGRQMSLKGKTLFISGASRGIGLAIALRAARDGANVALIAKTAEPHPNLERTVYTAAAQIEAAGGRALSVVGDIRNYACGVPEVCLACELQRWARVSRRAP